MITLIVTFDVDEAQVEAFRRESLAHAARCLDLEKGCLSFEVLRAKDKPARFLFYEVYADRAAFEDVHNKAPYLAAFREKVGPWIKGSDRACWLNAGPE